MEKTSQLVNERHGCCGRCNRDLQSIDTLPWRGRITIPCEVCYPEIHAEDKAEAEDIVRGIQAITGYFRYLKTTNVGRRYFEASFESFQVYGPKNDQRDQKRAIRLCMEYAEKLIDPNFGSWLILAGSTGTGKGHLACSILRRASELGVRDCKFIEVDVFLLEILATYRDDNPTTTYDYLHNLWASQVLVVDDLGRNTQLNDHEINRIGTLFNQRAKLNLPTIITTNLMLDSESPLGIKQIYGDAIYDRITDISNGNQYIPFDWPSYRKGVEDANGK